jgi:hypothetical protein
MTSHIINAERRNKDGHEYALIHRSTDGGRTWSSIRIGPDGFAHGTITLLSRNALELPDGTVLVGVTALDSERSASEYMWHSTDGGLNWDRTHRCNPIGFRSRFGFFAGEALLWVAQSGKLYAFVRVDSHEYPLEGIPIPSGGDNTDHLIVYQSTDQGLTFTRDRDSGDYGEMYPALLRLQDGRLLLTFTVRALGFPLGVHAIIGKESSDGFSFDWSHDRIQIDDRTPAGQRSGGGFGPTIQMTDGTLVTGYSYRAADGLFRVEVARWRLPAN